MTIGRKISLLCLTLLGLGAVQGTVSVITGERTASAVRLAATDSVPSLILINNVTGFMKDQRAQMFLFLSAKSAQERTDIETQIADFESKTQAGLKTYNPSDAEDKANLGKLLAVHEQLLRAWQKMPSLIEQGKTAESEAVFRTELLPLASETRKVLADMMNYNRAHADSSLAVSMESVASARLWVWIVLSLAIVLGGVLAFLLIRGINQALAGAAFELSEGAEQVSSAAGQVSASSQSLAQGSSEQAASLEETSASTEEITSMTRKNAENSRSAAQLVSSTAELVTAANHNLEQMVGSMQEINASSDKISRIIKVIDEIAFQTNILALNAAVEAARAGEAGMGFAVVAEEVRNLAQRSAQAAKDTAALIEESISKSNDGKGKLDLVGQAIHDITANVTQVKTLVDEVHLGSEEQARGIEQIAKAIAQMEQVTQKTAASAEESASASQELSAQAVSMNEVVGELNELVGAAAKTGHDRRQPRSHPALRHSSGPGPTNPSQRPSAASKPARPAHHAQPVAPVSVAPDGSFPLEEDFKEF